MTEMFQWILLTYVCGFIIKFIINFPLVFKIHEYYEIVNGKSDKSSIFTRILPVLSMAVVWPKALYYERLSFFLYPPEDVMRHGMVILFERQKAQQDAAE